AVHATDATNASRTLLFDIRARRWDPSLLRLFGVPRSLLPEVRPSISDFGLTRGVKGLPDGIPILGMAGDQQAALFGQGCVAAGGLKNTYGTGCFLLLHTGSNPVPSRSGLLTTIACGPLGEPRAALESSAFQSRDLVEAMRRDSRVRIRELRVDGGAAMNAFLMQFQADLLGIPISRPGLVETTALGAALLAGIGAGWWKRASDL